MRVDRLALNERLAAMMTEYGVQLSDDALDRITHVLADTMEDADTAARTA